MNQKVEQYDCSNQRSNVISERGSSIGTSPRRGKNGLSEKRNLAEKYVDRNVENRSARLVQTSD